jgi:TRAP-type C4-dicarboxylate transport system permease large subunit
LTRVPAWDTSGILPDIVLLLLGVLLLTVFPGLALWLPARMF